MKKSPWITVYIADINYSISWTFTRPMSYNNDVLGKRSVKRFPRKSSVPVIDIKEESENEPYHADR